MSARRLTPAETPVKCGSHPRHMAGPQPLGCRTTRCPEEDATMVPRILVLLLLVLGTTGLMTLPDPAIAQDAATPAASGDLEWAPCDDVADAECAWLEVPIDPAQPDGPQLSLRLARLPALGPSRSQ